MENQIYIAAVRPLTPGDQYGRRVKAVLAMSFLIGFAIGLRLSSMPLISRSVFSTPVVSTPATSTPAITTSVICTLAAPNFRIHEVKQATINLISEESSQCPVTPYENITPCKRPIPDMTVHQAFHHGKACANGTIKIENECTRCFCAAVLFQVPDNIDNYSEVDLKTVILGDKLEGWSTEEVVMDIDLRTRYYEMFKMCLIMVIVGLLLLAILSVINYYYQA